MIADFLKRFSPPGMSLKQEKRLFITGITVFALYSTSFFGRYFIAYNHLFRTDHGKQILIDGAVISDFRSLLGYFFIVFGLAALCMLGFVIYRYAYYRQGSMSIYLMKRLPKRREIHLRAWVIPLTAVLIHAAAAFIILMLYFMFYMLVTPKGCLPPDQWRILWGLSK